MRAYACYFGNGRFEAMATALRRSLLRNAPSVTPHIERIDAPSGSSFATNTDKLSQWVRVVNEAPEGERLALLDVDTIVLRDLAPAWEGVTHVGLTHKGTRTLPYNCGVVFTRVTPETRAFFREWQRVNDWFAADRDAHIPWERAYGGINQAAFGYLREHGKTQCVSDLPARIWNACHAPLWSTALETAAVVHYKSDLRRAIFSPARFGPPGFLTPLVNLWREYAETEYHA